MRYNTRTMDEREMIDVSESRTSIFFFFQAEDGIRDLTVTGVQTCALPISNARPSFARRQGVVLRDDVHRVPGIPSHHARVPPRRKERCGVRVAIPAPTPAPAGGRFRENEMHDIVGIARRVAGAVLAGRSEERRVGKE